MENVNIEEINSFLKSCNDFINGKFILAEVKISKVLQEIAKSKDIYNVIAECLVNFDFEKEFSKSRANNLMGGSNFKLPIEAHKIIPLVFCLLVEVDRKRIDFNYFLKTQFAQAETQKEEYDAFISTVMIPFKNAFMSMFGIGDAKEEEKQEDLPENVLDKPKILEDVTIERHEVDQEVDEDDVKDFFISVEKIADEAKKIIELIKNKKSKEEVFTLLDATIEACKIKNFKILNSLVYFLNDAAKKEKVLRREVTAINNLYFTYFK